MPGGSAPIEGLSVATGPIGLPRILRPSYIALFSGIGCALMCPALAVFLWWEAEEVESSARRLMLHGCLAFMALMSLGGIYLIAAWFREWLKVTENGFEWHELFRHRELLWSAVRKAVWIPEKGSARVRFYSDDGKTTLFLTQFAPSDRPWLMELIRERIPPERQEGWDQIAQAWERRNQAVQPIPGADRWLFTVALVGLLLLLIVWPGRRFGVVPVVASIALLFGLLLSLVALALSAWDLIRQPATRWLVAALITALLGCGLLALIIVMIAGFAAR